LAKGITPSLEIKYDGKALPAQTAKMISEVIVESRLDLPGSFSVAVTGDALLSTDRENGCLREGVCLEITLSYDKKQEALITGEISTVMAELSMKGVQARVTGFDMLHRLARGTNYRRFEDGSGEALTDSMIAQTLLNDAGLKPVVDDTPERSVPRVQDNRSDLDFLVILANLNDYYLYNEGDQAMFSASPPDRGEVTLAWNKNLRSFYSRLNLNGMVNNLESRGWDVALDESFTEALERDRKELQFLSAEGRGMMDRGSGGRSAINFFDAHIASSGDAKAFLSSALRRKQSLVHASGSCDGEPTLRAGTKLKIENIGRFQGDYFVTRAVHRYDSSGYTTNFEARISL